MTEPLAKKIIGTGALIFDKNKSKVLIVKPEYKNYWSFPGGIVEALEPPSKGLEREVKEELGLEISVTKLLVVEYLIKDEKNKKSESIQFLFLGEVLKKGEVFSNITLRENEIDEWKFVSINKAKQMMSKRSAKRLEVGLKSLKKNAIIYLEGK